MKTVEDEGLKFQEYHQQLMDFAQFDPSQW